MRVWLVTCLILFGLVEIYQWVKGFILPFPIYILGGAFLAIASNSEKGIGAFFNQSVSQEETLSQTATLVEPMQVTEQVTPALKEMNDENC